MDTIKTREAYDIATERRLTLLAMGWRPVPLCEKRPFMSEWNTTPVDAATVRSWPMKPSRLQPDGTFRGTPAVTTGIQLQGDTFVIDVDSGDEQLMGQVEELLALYLTPEVWATVPYRHSGGAKFMVMLRTETPFDTWRTQKYRDADGDDHMIEAFGGGALARQFAVDGPHTLGDIVDGRYQVLKRYEWEGTRTPFSMRPEDLTWIDDEHAGAILSALRILIDSHAEAQGWELVSRSQGHVDSGGRMFDLDVEASFTTQNYGVCSYEELATIPSFERLAASGFGSDGSNVTRCAVVHVVRDGVTVPGVFDYEDHVTHWPEGFEELFMQPDPNESAQELGLALAERFPERMAEAALNASAQYQEAVEAGADTTDFDECVQELMGGLAFDYRTGDVRWITRPGMIWSPVSLATVKGEKASFDITWEGPRGGQRRLSPVDVWKSAEEKLMISGVRFNPRTTERIYIDVDGESYGNAYFGLPDWTSWGPRPAAAGVIDDFVRHLVPDDTEREWLWQWMAKKYHSPWERNCAVLFVAPGVSGAGRGTLFTILDRVFGGYTMTVSQKLLLGGSDFNAHMENNLFVFCNEIGGIDWRARKAATESMKANFDPAATDIHINRKGIEAYRTHTFTSGMWATNNPNALDLDPEDRRVAVITNGGKLEAPLKDDVFRFSFDELAVAMAAQLQSITPTMAVDDAPLFAGREAMLDAADTDLNDAIREVIEEAPEWRAWVRSDFEAAVKLAAAGSTNARVPGLRSEITNLRGERAKRAGATCIDRRVKVGRSMVAVVAKKPDALLHLSPIQRERVCAGTEPGEDDTVVPINKVPDDEA